MTNAAAASLDRQLRRREHLVRAGRNPTQELRLGAIAKRFGVTEAELKRRLCELFPGSRDA